MALVVVCGQPCSGKSTAAIGLADALKMQSKLAVKIITDSYFDPKNNSNHGTTASEAEKNLRGMLRSEVDRSVSKDSIVIVDSLNNIKGYRYELWCLARAAGIRYCVLCCNVEEDACSDAVIDDQLRRFERPDQRNRWDAPLFELWPRRDGIHGSSATISAIVSYLTEKGDSNSWPVKTLRPTIATQTKPFSEPNSLYELDRATQEVIHVVVEQLGLAVGGCPSHISFGEAVPILNVWRPIGLPELRRLQRTFVKMMTSQASLNGPPLPSDAHIAKRMFVDYLNKQL